MNDIQRYDAIAVKSPLGDFVKYEDHISALEDARLESISVHFISSLPTNEQLESIANYFGLPPEKMIAKFGRKKDSNE